MSKHTEYIKPEYYDEFSCTASQCPQTCCCEWKIAVDDDTYDAWVNKYHIEQKTDANISTADIVPITSDSTDDTADNTVADNTADIIAGISPAASNTVMWEDTRIIRLNKDGKCPFLDNKGWCSLVVKHGEQILSKTCHEFPRQIHEFDTHTEYALMSGCPAVIDLIAKKDSFELKISRNNTKPAHSNTKTNETSELLYALRSKIIEWIGCKTSDKNTTGNNANNSSNTGNINNADTTDTAGIHDSTIKDRLLSTAYIMLEMYDNSVNTLADAGEYLSDEVFSYVLSEVKKIKIPITDHVAECNELFLDIIDNYLKEGMYTQYIKEPAEYAGKLSKNYNKTIKPSEVKEFKEALRQYEPLAVRLIQSELYSSLLAPDYELSDMLVKFQWIIMEYAAIKHIMFLLWKTSKKLPDYETLRTYIVVVSRMMGYSDEDIDEYMQNSFEQKIWQWSYTTLLLG